MRNPFLTLLNKRYYVASLMSLWFIELSTALYLCFLIQKGNASFQACLFMGAASILLIEYSFFLLYRLEGREYVRGDADRGLLRLLIDTLMLILEVVNIRFLCLIATGVVLSLHLHARTGMRFPLSVFIGILEVYLLYETVEWLKKFIRGIGWLPLLLFAVYLFSYSIGKVQTTPPKAIANFAQTVTTFPIFLSLFAICTLFSLLGAYCAIRKKKYGVPGPMETLQGVCGLGKARTRPFSSPAEALLWYEWKCHGWKLSAIFFVIGALLYVFSSDLYNFLRESYLLPRATYLSYVLPFVAIVLASPMVGWFNVFRSPLHHKVRSHFHRLRPVSNSDLALARLLITVKYFVLTTSLAAVISILLMVLFPNWGMKLLAEILSQGESNYRELLMLFTAPILVLLVLAWALHFREITFYLIPSFTGLCLWVYITALLEHNMVIVAFSESSRFLCLSMAGIIVCLFFFFALNACLRNLTPWRILAIILLLWGFSSSLALAISPERPLLFSVLITVLPSLLFIPFFTTPITIHKRRSA